MTRFLRTADGGLVNAEHIVRIERGGAILDDHDETFVKLDKRDSNDLDRLLSPVVAAAPGFVRLRYYDHGDGDQPWIERMPIVAWLVDQFQAYPVVAGDVDDGQGSKEAILLADGQVTEPYGERFDSEEAWRAGMDKRIRSRTPVEAKQVTS
jgi:hypothetical protein